MATRFTIDPRMTDQEILDYINSIKAKPTAEVETGEVAFPEDDAEEDQ